MSDFAHQRPKNTEPHKRVWFMGFFAEQINWIINVSLESRKYSFQSVSQHQYPRL